MQGHDDRFLDMWYEDTVSSPLDEIQRLYDFVGVDLTAEARAEMERWRDMNRREARPTHQYTLEEYGFTEEGLKNISVNTASVISFRAGWVAAQGLATAPWQDARHAATDWLLDFPGARGVIRWGATAIDNNGEHST
jgi:hypothetical protein